MVGVEVGWVFLGGGSPGGGVGGEGGGVRRGQRGGGQEGSGFRFGPKVLSIQGSIKQGGWGGVGGRSKNMVIGHMLGKLF